MFDDKEIVGLAEPFPDLDELRGKQFAKERTDTDVREIIAVPADCSAAAGVIAMLGMIKRLLHEPGERLWAALTNSRPNKVGQGFVGALWIQRSTFNVQRSTFNWPKFFNWASNVGRAPRRSLAKAG